MINHLLAAATDWAVITDLVVILVSAAIVAVVMQPVRLAAIPAYLVAGAVIGPRALGLIPAPESLGAITHLAIILLLFGIGLELHLSVLRHKLMRMVLAGLGSCLLSVLAGWPIAIAFGLTPPAALAICMALALSSTAVVLRIIADRRELRQMRGRLALSILVMQDMIVLGMLAAMPALAAWAGSGTSTDAATAGGSQAGGTAQFITDAILRIGGIAALIIFGRLILPPILRASLRARSLEIMTLTGVAVALLTAFVTQVIGFSLEMGAFLAGFMLAGTPFRHQLTGQIRPLRDIFIAVFFTAIGMKLDPAVIADAWWIILLGGAVMMVVKTTIITGMSWTVGSTASIAVAVGFSLSQAGEFSLIVLDSAYGFGIIDDKTASIAIAIVVISLILTPALVEFGGRFSRVASRVRHAPWNQSAHLVDTADSNDDQDGVQVVIAGYGPIGKQIAEELEREEIDYCVVELNPATVKKEAGKGRRIIFGDIGNVEILETAGISTAEALVLTIPDEEAVHQACSLARRLAPSIFIAARTTVVSRRAGLLDVGANTVIVDETSTANDMLRAVMASVMEEHDGATPATD